MEAPGWCPLVTTTSHGHCNGLCMHSGQHIQALSTTPHTHLSLGYLSGLGMCTPVSCSPSSGWIGEGPVQALKAGGGATFQDLKYLEHGLAAGERTWTKSEYVSLALGPHGTAGWGEVKAGQSKAL